MGNQVDGWEGVEAGEVLPVYGESVGAPGVWMGKRRNEFWKVGVEGSGEEVEL